MDTHLGWAAVSAIRNRAQIAGDYDQEVAIERGYFAGLAAFVAIWTFLLAALMAASISDNIKPAESDIDIATIEPPVPSYTPVPEAPAAVYSLPAVDASMTAPVWTPPVEEAPATAETIGEDRITIERNPRTNMPTKITIVGRSERGNTPNVISSESVTAQPVPAAPLPRSSEAPPAPTQDAATRVIDDIF